MQVSVVTPVYNAAPFIAEAVESALMQPETAEVVLVEDGSPDDSLGVCQELAAKYPDKVKLYQHPNGENRGAGASRNLAIANSIAGYIAFLDADDYFLPGRFTAAKARFAQDPTLDGVYDAIGATIHDPKSADKWHQFNPNGDLTTINRHIHPDELFAAMFPGRDNIGYFSLDGLALKSAVAKRIAPFNETLVYHQDTEFIFRLMATSRLAGGRLDQPVAMRRVHANNRITQHRSEADIFKWRRLLWHSLQTWSQTALSGEKQRAFQFGILPLVMYDQNPNGRWLNRLHTRKRLIWLARYHPSLLLRETYWRKMLKLPFR
jgi:glycosyltransferase involved in cell wall biosynthesis